MYAVIRSGGKQYRVAPGDVIRVERTPADGGQVVFDDILAVSGSEGQIARPQGGAQVVGRVVEDLEPSPADAVDGPRRRRPPPSATATPAAPSGGRSFDTG